MIFRADSVEAILKGRKTQTRRVVKDVCKYRVGQHYSVQPGRGRREVARVQITGIRREPLSNISRSPEDVRAEGFQSADEFAEVWEEIHGKLDGRQLVDVIDFVVVSKHD